MCNVLCPQYKTVSFGCVLGEKSHKHVCAAVDGRAIYISSMEYYLKMSRLTCLAMRGANNERKKKPTAVHIMLTTQHIHAYENNMIHFRYCRRWPYAAKSDYMLRMFTIGKSQRHTILMSRIHAHCRDARSL